MQKSEATVLVDAFYAGVLHRPSDEGGKNWWINKAVAEDLSREDLFFGFLVSASKEVGNLATDIAALKADVAALKKVKPQVSAPAVDIDDVVAQLVHRLSN